MSTRRVLSYNGEGKISVQEQEMPKPQKGQILIQVRASLISPGTELRGVVQRREKPDPKAASTCFGYSNAGEILQLGEGVTRFTKGQRVACVGGGFAFHATHAVIPQNLAISLPEGLSFEEGAFLMLSATALFAIRRAEPEIGEHFAVVGLGPVGQLSTQFARIAGTHVMGWDRLPLRLNAAKKTGCHCVVNVGTEKTVEVTKAFTQGHGLDAGIIAFGGDV